MRYLTALCMVLTLSGCGPTQSIPADKTMRKLTAPTLFSYTKQTQAKAAEEVKANTCPVLIEMGKDYHIVRKQIRRLNNDLNK